MVPRACKRGLLAASLLLITPRLITAQSSYPQPGPRPPAPAETARLSAGGVAATAKYEQLRQSRSLVERAQAMQNPLTRVRTVIDLADLLWAEDEAYARRLFDLAYHDLKAGGDATAAERDGKKKLIAALLVKLTKRDYKAGRQLMTAAEGVDPAVNIQAARALVESDPARAAELAEQTLSEATLQSVNAFLFDLRLKDAAAADALFMRVLKFTADRPTVDAELFARLGTYVFRSPAVPPDENGYEVSAVGNQFAVNLSADRAGVPATVTRAYLNAAVTLLTRPVADPRQQQLYYITGRQLAPRVRKLLPSREPEFAQGMRNLSGTVPEALTRDSTYAPLSAESYRLDLDVSLGAIGRARDETARDEICVGVAHAFLEGKKFDEALVVAGKIGGAPLRSEVTDLIHFRRAADSLELGDVSQAQASADALAPGAARVLLRLGIARKLADRDEKDAAAEYVNKALYDVRKMPDGVAPLLLFAAAGVTAKIDSVSASQTLEEGVQALNRQENIRPGAMAWSAQVKAGRVSRAFPLTVAGVPASIRDALLPLLASDYQGTLSNILAIRDEQVLGQALVAAAAATLPPPPWRP